jgi:hypothetical protein
MHQKCCGTQPVRRSNEINFLFVVEHAADRLILEETHALVRSFANADISNAEQRVKRCRFNPRFNNNKVIFKLLIRPLRQFYNK